MHSGFDDKMKERSLGHLFRLFPNSDGNLAEYSNVPDIRAAYRWDTYLDRLIFIARTGKADIVVPKWCVNVTYEAAAATYTERNNRAMQEGISLDDVDLSYADEVTQKVRGTAVDAESKSTNSRRQAVLELLKNPDRLEDVEELIIDVVCGTYLATGRKKVNPVK